MTRPSVEVAELVLRILDEGRYTATYKQAVLVALVDVCLQSTRAGGAPQDMVTTRQLAERVLALYWPHTRIWGTGSGSRILVQNASGGPATLKQGGGIVAMIREFREETERVSPGTASLPVARARRGQAFNQLVDEIEWTLISMPLPKLQRIGDRNTEWLYRISWRDVDEKDPAHLSKPLANRRAVRAYQRGQPSDFDNRIQFSPGVAAAFARLHALLRPYILRHWTAQVVRLNGLDRDDVEGFLFEHEREDTAAIRSPLVELQDGRCFYCASRMTGAVHVDHFVPWARHPDNGLHNLVAADEKCNGSKKDYLASATHIERWRKRSLLRGHALEQIAASEQWDLGSERILGVARAIYLTLPEEMPLWQQAKKFEPSVRDTLRQALVA